MCALLPPWAPQGVIVAHRSMVKSLAAYDTLLLDIGLLVLLGLIMGAAQVGGITTVTAVREGIRPCILT